MNTKKRIRKVSTYKLRKKSFVLHHKKKFGSRFFPRFLFLLCASRKKRQTLTSKPLAKPPKRNNKIKNVMYFYFYLNKFVDFTSKFGEVLKKNILKQTKGTILKFFQIVKLNESFIC